jgi:hypothetical protein
MCLGALHPNAEDEVAVLAGAKGDKVDADQLAICEVRGR